MSELHNHGFLKNGCDRAGAAIREQVRLEYEERLKNASAAERRRLEREINEEINRRIETQAPPDALY